MFRTRAAIRSRSAQQFMKNFSNLKIPGYTFLCKAAWKRPENIFFKVPSLKQEQHYGLQNKSR